MQNTVELLIPDPVLSQKIAGYLDSQYDMTQESAFVSVLDPGIEGYLSHLADVVEQRTGNQEVSVDAFTLFPHGTADLHHPQGVFQEPARVIVVYGLGGR